MHVEMAHTSERAVLHGIYGHIHRKRAIFRQSRASPGSSVGNTNNWILFVWSIVVIVLLCFRSDTSHSVQSTPKHRFFFDPSYPILTIKEKKGHIEKSAIVVPW